MFIIGYYSDELLEDGYRPDRARCLGRRPAPKKISPEKPSLSDSFTKTCLKALLAIRDFKGTGSLTGPAKDAYEDAQSRPTWPMHPRPS